MKTLGAGLIVALFTTVSAHNYIEMTENFEGKITGYPVALVKFFAPWLVLDIVYYYIIVSLLSK